MQKEGMRSKERLPALAAAHGRALALVPRILGAATSIVALAFATPVGRAESLHEAIIAAWSADPEARSSQTDANAAHKSASALDAWFPSGPVLSGEYLDDHFIGSKVGYTTYQGSVSMPLWLPGQGSASVRNAQADESVARSRLKVQRLLMAVRVLDLTSAAVALRREIANLRSTQGLLDQTLSASQKALRTGEIAASDHEAIVAEREDVAGQIPDREQRIETARAELLTLTGTDEIPDLMALDGRLLAARVQKLDPRNDPRIELADALVGSAKASYDLAKRSYMPNPEIGVSLSRQEQYGSPWDTQFGVQFQTALPSSARNVPMLMKGVSAMGAANRDAELARRKVAVEYRQAEARMSSALVVLGHARATQQALSARASQLGKAWSVGETPVIEYLRARRAELDANQRATQADVLWRSALVRILLMTGQTP